MSTRIRTSRRQNWPRLSRSRQRTGVTQKKVLTLFGTRPEAIKLAPVIREMEADSRSLQTVNVASGQHTDLIYPFVNLLGIRVDYDLQVMEPNQTPNQVCARVLRALDDILTQEQPGLILVQGDTTTALAGALAGFHRKIAVGHVEAGLRSGNPRSPYPEEMNRRMITKLATHHFAATSRNRMTLLAEGVERKNIHVTGNPVVDSLKAIIKLGHQRSSVVENLLKATDGTRRIILTTHRRESFGEVMLGNLATLRQFVEEHEDVSLIFPVHPNPSVVNAARAVLSCHPRVHLIEPLGYEDFIGLLSSAWLIVSDSGGVQEEAPTLGKPLLVLRENTERPEALDSGIARLVGGNPARLGAMLEEAYGKGSWASEVHRIENPFGAGDSGRQIASIISGILNVQAEYDAVAVNT